jgi:hypothetical protein
MNRPFSINTQNTTAAGHNDDGQFQSTNRSNAQPAVPSIEITRFVDVVAGYHEAGQKNILTICSNLMHEISGKSQYKIVQLM